MNMQEWSKNIYLLLSEIADEDYQKRVWLLGNNEEQSSFTEVICSLYDEYDFEEFLNTLISENIGENVIFPVQDLDRCISQYLDKINDCVKTEDILNDPDWKIIQSKAAEASVLIKPFT